MLFKAQYSVSVERLCPMETVTFTCTANGDALIEIVSSDSTIVLLILDKAIYIIKRFTCMWRGAWKSVISMNPHILSTIDNESNFLKTTDNESNFLKTTDNEPSFSENL